MLIRCLEKALEQGEERERREEKGERWGVGMNGQRPPLAFLSGGEMKEWQGGLKASIIKIVLRAERRNEI